jgi:curved DNA-binding protein CbpA
VDHYRTLQVTRNADAEVIERAYKALALKYHPDRGSADPARAGDLNARMQAINAAYAVLRDPERRRAYDRTLAPEGADGWDRFLEEGLIGLFKDRFLRRRR